MPTIILMSMGWSATPSLCVSESPKRTSFGRSASPKANGAISSPSSFIAFSSAENNPGAFVVFVLPYASHTPWIGQAREDHATSLLIPALLSADQIDLANSIDSSFSSGVSLPYAITQTDIPANGLSLATSLSICSWENVRGPSSRSSFARSSDSCSARSLALTASPFANATNRRVASRMSLSVLPASIWTRNSPATPIATNPAPRNPKPNIKILGLSGEWITPRLKSRQSCLYSMISTTNSKATPATTRIVQKFSHQSSDDQDFSRLSSVLARADASIGRFYNYAYRAATLQLIAVSALFVVAAVILITIEIFMRRSLRAVPPPPTRQPNQQHPTADPSRQRPSRESCGGSGES